MTLPDQVRSALFPDDAPRSLCGISLGDPLEGAQLPSWWNESRDGPDESVRYGWLEVKQAGIAQMCCLLKATLGRVSHVDFSLVLDDEASERAAFDALEELLARRCGRGKRAGDATTWQLPDGGELHLHIASFTMDRERYHRVDGSLDVAPVERRLQQKRATTKNAKKRKRATKRAKAH